MRTIYAGCDPGKDGALVAIEVEPGAPPAFWDTPTLPGSKGGKRLYDERQMAAHVRQLQAEADARGERLMVVIEKQQAMPKQGVSSMFSIGMGYGLWLGICAGAGVVYTVVSPLAWKRVLLADYSEKDKGAAVQVASRLFPAAAPQLRGPRGGLLDGRADALLIAEWGRRADGRSVAP